MCSVLVLSDYRMDSSSDASYSERKLFVGMLSKKWNESDVLALFSPHGIIEECTILRDSRGSSKGCAFITYDNRTNAQEAIKVVHQSQTMEVSDSLLYYFFTLSFHVSLSLPLFLFCSLLCTLSEISLYAVED